MRDLRAEGEGAENSPRPSFPVLARFRMVPDLPLDAVSWRLWALSLGVFPDSGVALRPDSFHTQPWRPAFGLRALCTRISSPRLERERGKVSVVVTVYARSLPDSKVAGVPSAGLDKAPGLLAVLPFTFKQHTPPHPPPSGPPWPSPLHGCGRRRTSPGRPLGSRPRWRCMGERSGVGVGVGGVGRGRWWQWWWCLHGECSVVHHS